MKKFIKRLVVIFKRISIFVLPIIIFGILSIVFALFDEGLAWENLDSSFIWTSYLTLIIYRVAIYIVPGLLMFYFGKSKSKETLLKAFENQFISYAFLKVGWEFFALDFILSTAILDQMDSGIIMIGLLLSLVIKKRVKIETNL